MTEMIRKTACSEKSDCIEGQKFDLEKIYRGMRELEYTPTKIREFSESFNKLGLVAVHLSSLDRWEKLRMRISPEIESNALHEQEEAELPAASPNFLEEISLLDLTVGTCYIGRAVCGTLCVEPFTSVKIFTSSKASATIINSLLEDNRGRVVRMIVNLGTPDKYLESAQMSQAVSSYQKGSMVGVESPVLRRCGWDKGLILYVDNPAKVHFMTDPGVPAAAFTCKTAEDKLNEAIALFSIMEWYKAEQVYTQCIDICWQLKERLSSNCLAKGGSDNEQVEKVQAAEELMWLAYSGRCAAWLQQKNYSRALSDANKALDLESQLVNHSLEDCIPNLHSMRGRALFGLERFQEAANALNVSLQYNPERFQEAANALNVSFQYNPEDKSVQRALQRSRLCHDLESVLPNIEGIQAFSNDSPAVKDSQCAYQQSQHGEYDLSEYFLSGETIPPPIYASYVGPVEIRTQKTAGRGLFLKEPVVAGQLLIVSEALALLTRNPKRLTSYKSVLAIIGEDFESSARRESMTLDIQEDLVTQVACKMLSSKKLVPQVYSLSDGRSDQSKVIPDMKMFLPGPASEDNVLEGKNELSDDNNVNIKILREIVAENAICDSDSEGNIRSWGVWSLPSFINHSCYPNSHKMKVGDYLLIRTSQEMCAGTEITLPYFNVFQFVDGRRLDCMALGFVCRCKRCLFESRLPCCFSNLQRKVTEVLEVTMFEDDDLNTGTCSNEKPPSLLHLARLAEALEQEMLSNGFTDEEKNWIRASIVDPYLACTRLSNYDLQELHPSSPGIRRADRMSLLVDAFIAVNAGHKLGRKYSAHLLHEVGHDFGWGSQEQLKQEVRVMKIFRTYYGINDTEVLRQLIAKVRMEH